MRGLDRAASIPGDRFGEGGRALEMAERSPDLQRDLAYFDSVAAVYARLGQKRRQFTISILLLTSARRTAGAVRMTGNMQFPSDSPLAILVGADRTATVSQFRDSIFSYSRVLISDTTDVRSEIQNFNSRVHL